MHEGSKLNIRAKNKNAWTVVPNRNVFKQRKLPSTLRLVNKEWIVACKISYAFLKEA